MLLFVVVGHPSRNSSIPCAKIQRDANRHDPVVSHARQSDVLYRSFRTPGLGEAALPLLLLVPVESELISRDIFNFLSLLLLASSDSS